MNGTVPLLEAALAYTGRGWPVLPLHGPTAGRCSCGRADCGSPGKHPRTAHGLADASTDADQVRRWWERWPDANVGLRTGIAFDVLDLDNTDDALDQLDAAAPDGPPVVGPMVHTGNGLHIYVAPTGAGNRARMLAGVDWRGDGGYVVAPPSLHANGLTYQWSAMFPSGTPLQPAPAWLAHLLRRNTTPTPTRAQETGSDRYGARALESELGRLAVAAEGERNDHLVRSAFRLGRLVAAGRLDARSAAQGLLTVALRIGLSEDEALRTIHSGMSAGMSRPREVRS